MSEVIGHIQKIAKGDIQAILDHRYGPDRLNESIASEIVENVVETLWVGQKYIDFIKVIAEHSEKFRAIAETPGLIESSDSEEDGSEGPL